jgi:hypothetical protein
VSIITYWINDSNHAIWNTSSGSRAIEEDRFSAIDFQGEFRTLIFESARYVHFQQYPFTFSDGAEIGWKPLQNPVLFGPVFS